jgi:predicted phosphodiesterase
VRVAALYDVHGNLPALEAVLAELEAEPVDAIVFGGDVVSGPLPRETLALVESLGERALLIRGNAERALAEVWRGEREPAYGSADAFYGERLTEAQIAYLDGLPPSLVRDVDGLGRVQFCHATPRDDEEIFLETTPDEVVAPMLAGAGAPVVVCGHTHMQLDRRVGEVRVVNAGSVGMPYEAAPGAYWALLGPGVELRRTEYDGEAAAARILAGGWPRADEFVRENVLVVPTRAEALAVFEPQVAGAS